MSAWRRPARLALLFLVYVVMSLILLNTGEAPRPL